MSAERLLLDTHALIWWLNRSDRLPPTARDRIADGAVEVLVSSASLWEIAIKVRTGKLREAETFLASAAAILARENFEPLPISHADAVLAGGLDTPHRDPFDRMLVAQALLGELTLVSNETLFDTVVHNGRTPNRVWE